MSRLLKLAVISVAVLFIVILLISLLLPSHVRISRAIDISASKEKIYPMLSDIARWESWNEYIKAYHNRITEQDMLKADEIAIFLSVAKDSSITTEWQQPSGRKFGSGFAIMGDNHKHSFATVQWYFDFHLKWYPWEKFQSIVYDQQLGPVMEKSLANLKRIAENSR